MRGAVVAAAGAWALCMGPAHAQTTALDPVAAKVMFREAVLGYCAQRVTGTALVEHRLDPKSNDWVDIRPDVQTTGGQKIFSGRVHKQTSVIVDVSASGTSCFVQVNLPEGKAAAVRAALVEELKSRFSATSLQQFPPSDAGFGELFGLITEASDSVPLVAVNQDKTGDVATAIVQLGQKQKKSN